jgi:hypothetical protein
MSSNQVDRTNSEDLGPSEVEFALVLARIIDAVGNDEEQLRQTVYELARYKLSEQLAQADSPKETEKSKKALEIAIRGVEAFARKDRRTAPALENLTTSAERGSAERISQSIPFTARADETTLVVVQSGRVGWRAAVGRVVGLMCVLIGIMVAVRYSENLGLVSDSRKDDKTKLTSGGAQTDPEQTLSKPLATKSSQPLPTNFGVYGVSDGNLFELNLLPSRAQDMRIALTPTVATSNQPVLANGRVKFIVYRREAALSIPDRAEVRIIAKVPRAISFDAAGKPLVSPDEGWYIRNISFPYRVSPIKENPEMFEIRAEDEAAQLSPGRYALVVKGQVYDFIVDGQITDLRHCLERLTAANGTFVSECKTL